MKRISALLCALLLLFTGCAAEPAASSSSGEPPVSDTEIREPAAPTVAHLMVAGDMMSHMPLTKAAYRSDTGTYDYSPMLRDPAGQLAHADYAVVNLETVLADGPYSGYPRFNSPAGLAESAGSIGFDLFSTANNHSYDQGFSGVCHTLDALDALGIAHVGSYRSLEERTANHGIYVADVGGISVAFLSYTYGLNGFRMKEDQAFAVNVFNRDYYTTLADPDYAAMAADMEAARALDTDLIAVLMHWGTEYQNSPNHYQTSMAEFLVQQGADLILGGHPHVLQPYETISAVTPEGETRQGFVCYSLGNFLSNQKDAPARVTAILDLELTKDPISEKTTLTDVRYTPYYMFHNGTRHALMDIHAALDDFAAGGGRISSDTASQLEAALSHCHTILGADGDKPSF